MRKATLLTLLCVIASSVTSFGLTLAGEAEVFLASMEHINSLIDSFDNETGTGLGPMRAGVGVTLGMPIIAYGDFATLSVGAEGLMARRSSSQTTAIASCIGVLAEVSMAFGPFRASADALICRGSFDFPGERLVGLSASGVGVRGSLGYTLQTAGRLVAELSLGYRHLPFTEMMDGAGHTYRGRGTPFMDFSGITASIGIEWMVSERSNE